MAAFLSELDFGHLLSTEKLLHLVLDGLTMAIPSRHKRSPATPDGFIFNHKILENLVQSGSQVNVAVGVWGPVMKNKSLSL
jgi:hypothetical protein